MNDMTTQGPSHFSGSQEQSTLAIEMSKMLALVAPITMTADQQTAWLASAIDSLTGIRASEVVGISLEVRRAVSRPSQIVPEIAKLVAEKRARKSSIREAAPMIEGPPPKRDILNRDRRNFKAADWAELNARLEMMGAGARYRPDGTRYLVVQ